ncbi:MAG: PIN domain-containing protein [bacterium]
MKSYILDTNVYLSFFTSRDKSQYEIALGYINKLQDQKIKINLPELIIAEIIYILHDHYNFERQKITEALQSLIAEENLIVGKKEVVLSSLDYFESTKLDFADCFILALSEAENCELVSFDKKLRSKVK